MTKIMHIPNDQTFVKYDENEFHKAIYWGLTQKPKKIESKFFYDEKGSEIFNQITRHPDYYLTRCELEILNTYKKQIETIIDAKSFNLIELGPGEGIKTQQLLEQFILDSLDFSYIPIDISEKCLQQLVYQFNQVLPMIKLIPLHADFFHGLEWLSKYSDRKNFVLFLGSSIGNFDPQETINFLQHLRAVLNKGDFILLGFDLRKDIDVLMRAYNDRDGITKEFNLNLLKRINRELRADFDLTRFSHYATYNAFAGAMESYLISSTSQVITVESLGIKFSFDNMEAIHVENSYKYSLPAIEKLASAAGFKIVENFTDRKRYFVDSLWCAI